MATYSAIQFVSDSTSDSDRLRALSNAVQRASFNVPVATSILINEGDAGLGTPLVFTATDKKLVVESSLLKRYDVYWLQLAISPSEELIHNVVELKYDISFGDPQVLAMAIVPVRYGSEVNETDKVNTPTVKVADVEVGEMFSRTIEYKYLRPTILGHGAQLSEFGWIFTGDSLDASTKRMFAVIGVPKGTRQITARFQLAVKLSTFLGLATNLASTGPIPYTISLPQ